MQPLQLLLSSSLLSLVALVGACGNGSATAADASGSAIFDASANDANAIDAMSSEPDACPGNCPSDRLCLVNKALGTAAIPNGRVVAAFYQFSDNLTPYPPIFVGYDEPFDGSEEVLEILRSGITPPSPLNDYSLCERICTNLSSDLCNCQGTGPQATMAYVFVLSDADGSGAIEPEEITEDNIFGVAGMHIGSAEQDFPIPNTLDSIFTDGILQGEQGYSVEPGDGIFDVLTVPETGAYFEMELCVPGSTECDDLQFPNLT